MSEYDKFFGNPVDVEISGVKCQMKPLTVADLGLMRNLEDPEKQVGAIKEVLKKTLIPAIDPEAVEKISLQHFPKILEKVMEINGLDKNVPEPPKPKV